MNKIYIRYALFSLVLIAVSGRLTAQQIVAVEPQEEVPRFILAAAYPFLDIRYGIRTYAINYTTPDVFGVQDTASGLLVVPYDATPGRTHIFPTAVYQHGTSNDRQNVPSVAGNGERQLAYVMGGSGYYTIAPDYLGLGVSRGPHPYVHAASEASAALDMLRAAQRYAEDNNIMLNDQLFITGYSQGGHAAAALHQAIEQEHRAEFSVTASAPMSGPYSISGITLDRMLSDSIYFFPAYLVQTFLSYNYVYRLYDDLNQVFKPAYIDEVEFFRDGVYDLEQLNESLIVELEREVGGSIMRHLLQDSIQQILRSGGDHPMLQALRDNDVYDWTPEAPVLFAYCQADDQVDYRNSILADSVMNARGAANVSKVDANTNADHGGCVVPAMLRVLQFFQAYQQITTSLSDIRLELPAPTLAPNPVQNAFLLPDLQGMARLEIWNAVGQRVLTRAAVGAGETIEVGSLPTGWYSVRLWQPERAYAPVPLLIQR